MDPLPQSELDAAAAVRRLGLGLLSRAVPAELSAATARRLDELIAEVERCRLLTTEEIYPQPAEDQLDRWKRMPDGEEFVFDARSFVGGRLNPASGNVRFYRDGDEAVARATLSLVFEGPPERVHGGMVAAVFDEVMSSAARIKTDGPAFTGTLTVRFEGPAPLDVEVEFRAVLVAHEGRKHHVEAVASGPSGPFARAEAVFIEPRPLPT